jgi:hypothetical protein
LRLRKKTEAVHKARETLDVSSSIAPKNGPHLLTEVEAIVQRFSDNCFVDSQNSLPKRFSHEFGDVCR